jgi:hypothetical protein
MHVQNVFHALTLYHVYCIIMIRIGRYTDFLIASAREKVSNNSNFMVSPGVITNH